ncbi:MAG: imidazoleglycerol-phosphate dehydratase [Thermoleophilia bacterium]|nr:imidazoleglycerol-phosphate dehydratase [Thermoleophilia bacterium]
MASSQPRARRAAVRLGTGGRGDATVSTGLPVLDHLLGLVARHAALDVALEVAPGGGVEGVLEAARSLGERLAEVLPAGALGAAVVPSDEALAQVVLEASGRPLVVSNVDLSPEHVGGLGTDVVSRFLGELAQGAGLTLHVRLVEGRETQHVLDAIFKGLGAALGEACRPRT